MTDIEIRYYLFELMKVWFILNRHWTIVIVEESCIEMLNLKISSLILIKKY